MRRGRRNVPRPTEERKPVRTDSDYGCTFPREAATTEVRRRTITQHDEHGALSLRVWGARGSIPAPGPETVRYGGNTPCVELRCGADRVVLDAGTGIRRLGYELAASRETDVTVLLTHFHWDHIQGLPFFMPLYGPDTTVRLVGPRVGDRGVEALVTGQWDAGYFSIPFRELRADVEWEELAGTDGARPGSGTGREVGALRVTWMRVRHPSSAVAYRVEASGRSVCYAPDNELAGGEYAVGPDWRSRFVDFVSGADLLLHDSMFTEEEYGEREGWGHSTFGQVLDLAAEAGVERLAFFHHAPDRTDDELDAILARARADAAKEGLALEVDAAREDEELIV